MSSNAVVVEAVVDDKVVKGELFTAHDVTLEVRNRGHRVKHDEVRDAVHDYFGRGGLGIAYTRTNISVPGGGQPYLYHRTVDDPSTYNNVRGGTVTTPVSVASNPAVNTPNQNNQTIQIPVGLVNNGASNSAPPSSVAGVAIAPKSVSNQTKNKPGTETGRNVDGRGTLSIPSPLLRKVGLKAGDKVYAVIGNNSLLITKDNPVPVAPQIEFSKYTVDKASQVRVTQSLLKRAGIGGNKYDVKADGANSTVTVKLHS